MADIHGDPLISEGKSRGGVSSEKGGCEGKNCKGQGREILLGV